MANLHICNKSHRQQELAEDKRRKANAKKKSIKKNII